MICSNSEPWIFGAESLFVRLGYSACTVSWIEFVMVACTVGVIIMIAGTIAYTIARRVEWVYLKMRTRNSTAIATDTPH